MAQTIGSDINSIDFSKLNPGDKLPAVYTYSGATLGELALKDRPVVESKIYATELSSVVTKNTYSTSDAAHTSFIKTGGATQKYDDGAITIQAKEPTKADNGYYICESGDVDLSNSKAITSAKVAYEEVD